MLKRIWENRINILQGLVNRVFSSKEVRELANKRLEKCNPCEFNSENSPVKDNIPYKHCMKCGCSLGLKPYSKDSKCPIGKW